MSVATRRPYIYIVRPQWLQSGHYRERPPENRHNPSESVFLRTFRLRSGAMSA